MISPTELRIGNYIAQTTGDLNGNIIDKVIKVVGVFEDELLLQYKEEDSNWDFPSKYNPIPLTPEILKKCGFMIEDDLGDMIYYEIPNSKSGYGVCYDHKEWQFYYFAPNGYTVLIYNKEYFQHLHQLQNLYHALTGTELEINL